METERRVDSNKLKDFASQVYQKIGVPEDEAELVADTLVTADLHGMHSHGVMRVPQYGRKIIGGGFKPGRKGRILKETESTILLDGENGLGQVITVRAMKEAIRKAKKAGCGIVGVTRSNHNGAGAYYASMAVKQDMIGILTTNGSPNMPIWGGMTKMTGPLPLTVGVPARNQLPFCLDTALGVSSKGKIVYAAEKGEKIPFDWAVDKEGKPTDDPKKYLDGGWILPIGGYKGFGITTALEILTGILTGGPFGPDVGNLFTGPPEESQGLGHFVMALNVEGFMPVEDFKDRMDRMILMMKESRLQPGVKEIIIAGEPEFRNEKDRLVNGIPLSVKVISDIIAFAEEIGVTNISL